MKTTIFLTCFSLFFFFVSGVSAQDNKEERLNMPGDNLNLYAVMQLFQESETLEGFEKNLNAEDSKINNLDLNGDDLIDYIKVIDYPDGDDHTIVLQVAVNERENQDVAVFTVQKDANNQAHIQLIGDEELYGKDYIIEPNSTENVTTGGTPNPGYTGNNQNVNGGNYVPHKTVYVEVAAWPLIRLLFLPTYVCWHSPWYWGYYPTYWNPWRPYYWDYYYGYHSHLYHNYYRYYHYSHEYHYAHYNVHYYNGHRSYSNTVYQRRESGSYNNTYSHPESRTQGTADYNSRHRNTVTPTNRQGNANANHRVNTQQGTKGNRTAPNQGENRSGSGSGNVNHPTHQGNGNASPRQGNVNQAPRNGNVNQTPRSENRNVSSPSRSGGNKQSAKPASRSNNNQGSNKSSSRQNSSNSSHNSSRSNSSGGGHRR